LIQFCDVRVEHVALIWPSARPHIVRALGEDTVEHYRPQDILALLLQAKARLWVAWDAERRAVIGAVVTEIIEFPNGLRELRAWLVGGRNMKQWFKPGMEMLEDFARAQGCSYVTGGFRKGWLRIDRGMKQTGITLSKAL